MMHEFPEIKRSNPRYFEERMAFTIESGIYIKDKFGVGIEDTVLISKNGTGVLNRVTKNIIIL